MTCPSCRTENEDSATACRQCGGAIAAPTSVVVSVDLSTGALFHGRYEIQGPLGRGGMGMVYKARDRTLDEVVAIKVLRPDFAQDPRMAERFRSEIKLARKVRHRNVCAIHDYGEDRGLLYISMELLDGVDMKQVLRERGGLPAAEAYDVSIQVAEGLQAVHDAGIIHRDLKTPNIMVDRNHVARLMDFGIAKSQDGGRGGASTATGHVLGTPEYMSPEQAQGKKLDARSDIYALGIVIYEIFTGEVPFRGDTPISTILKHLHDPPPLDATSVPKALRPVLRRALAKEPEQRFATATALAEALREARSPSRKQQPLSTAALEAPTLPRPGAPAPTRRSFAPWWLSLPIVALGAGVWLLRGPAAPAPSVASVVTPAALPAPPTTTAAGPPTSLTQATAPPSLPPATRPPTPRPTPRPRPTPTIAVPAPAQVATVVPTTSPPAPTTTAPAAPGMLQVVVRPWAEVSVDGRLLGTTPMDRVSLSAGAHSLTLKHPAFEALTRSVTVRSGETTRLVVDFAVEGTKKP